MASVTKILSADVADDATITVDYKEGVSIPEINGTYVFINNNRYDQDDGEITVVRGTTSAVITNNTGQTWQAGHKLSVEFSEIERKEEVYLTQEMFDAIVEPDINTQYNIVEVA